MSKLSREARRRIYEEESARLAEERRQADERTVAAMSPEERKKIHSEEVDRRGSKITYIVLAVLGLAIAYYYGLEHIHEQASQEVRAFQPKLGDDPRLKELDAAFMGTRIYRTREDIEALERWMPWRW